ncbi:unnamed protein product [Gadus morhua 'NCC']
MLKGWKEFLEEGSSETSGCFSAALLHGGQRPIRMMRKHARINISRRGRLSLSCAAQQTGLRTGSLHGCDGGTAWVSVGAM